MGCAKLLTRGNALPLGGGTELDSVVMNPNLHELAERVKLMMELNTRQVKLMRELDSQSRYLRIEMRLARQNLLKTV